MGAADNLTKREAAIAAFASEQATRIYSLLRHLPPRSRRPPLPPARLRPAGYTVDTATCADRVSAAFSVAPEEGALHVKLYTFKLFARSRCHGDPARQATIEIAKDIHV